MLKFLLKRLKSEDGAIDKTLVLLILLIIAMLLIIGFEHFS
jgi:hypothetical protein